MFEEEKKLRVSVNYKTVFSSAGAKDRPITARAQIRDRVYLVCDRTRWRVTVALQIRVEGWITINSSLLNKNNGKRLLHIPHKK